MLYELYFQLCVIGFFRILKEKLLKEFPYNKIIKFYITLFIISIFFGIFIIYECKKNDIMSEKERKTIFSKILNFYSKYYYIYFCGFALFAFISSICFYVIKLTKNIYLFMSYIELNLFLLFINNIANY